MMTILASLNTVNMILSMYHIPSVSVHVNDIKHCVWKHFVDDCSHRGLILFN